MDNEYKLREEIIKLSKSKDWKTAKEEWEFEQIYVSDDLQQCLCGHYPIINICKIRNKVNDEFTEVGNVCIKKFLNIENGEKLLPSINRIKKDILKSMSNETLDYLCKKDYITARDYDFYHDIIKKRKLTEPQRKWKCDINNKLLRGTSYEANHILERIEIILNWAENEPTFDTKTINSFRKQYMNKGSLSEKQEQALNNIIREWKIK